MHVGLTYRRLALALLVASLTGCDVSVPNVTIVPSETTPTPAVSYKAPLPCDVENSEFYVLSNAAGNGSTYFGTISKCANGVSLLIELWTAGDARFELRSNACQKEEMGGALPPVDDRKSYMDRDIGKAKDFLSSQISAFGKSCSIKPDTASRLLDQFEDVFARELKVSWIHNRYIEKLDKKGRLGWANETFKEEARQEYAQTH